MLPVYRCGRKCWGVVAERSGVLSNGETVWLMKRGVAWGRREMHIRYWWENLKERDHLADLVVDGIVKKTVKLSL
jgi:hypothetical protein